MVQYHNSIPDIKIANTAFCRLPGGHPDVKLYNQKAKEIKQRAKEELARAKAGGNPPMDSDLDNPPLAFDIDNAPLKPGEFVRIEEHMYRYSCDHEVHERLRQDHTWFCPRCLGINKVVEKQRHADWQLKEALRSYNTSEEFYWPPEEEYSGTLLWETVKSKWTTRKKKNRQWFNVMDEMFDFVRYISADKIRVRRLTIKSIESDPKL